MKVNDEIIIALDFGTSNLKGAVFDIYGKEYAFESIEYSLYTPTDSIVENNVDFYWDNIITILKNLSKKLGNKTKNVIAIGTSSQGETIVPIDKNGNPLRNAIVWIDTRTTSEVEEIASHFNPKDMFKITGYPEVDTSWPATRILWIRKNEPDIFQNTYKFLLLEDYLVYKLTGKFVGEASVYSSSYYYDIVNYTYFEPMLDYLKISKDKLPEVLMPGTEVSKIKKEVAKITGLPEDVKIIIGAMDQICGAVGAGNIYKGIVSETTGSCFAMVITIDKPIFDYNYKLPCTPHATKGTYALMPYSPTGGIVLKWFKDRFCQEEQALANKKNKSVFKIMDEMAANVPPGSEGLIMLPFLTGALFPEFNPNARAVFFNFSINHTKAHFIRSILESIGYMMMNYLNSAKKLGIDVEKIISIGGGASSNLWCQIKSDMAGLKIEVPEYTETALLGSAILTFISLGFFKNIKDASKNLTKIEREFIPDKKNKDIYGHNFKKYKRLYESLKDLY
ncbi:MAG: FGGY family carbohydrate kinase [Actinomycetota bacterium]|nr:FGGY family carbohydrate kinase [Actinomycetota bacterium]